jgi:hypothetical protein
VSDVFISLLLVLVAIGAFCLGYVYKARDHMDIWQRGFNEAKRIYRPEEQ